MTDAVANAAPATGPIGPGRLVLIVGPSGAGKDAVLNGAKVHCAGNESIVFPRRVVTRPAGPYEDHDSVDVASFDRLLQAGSFMFWWEAHGLKYAVPRTADDAVKAGRVVVCNVSRSIIDNVRARYAHVLSVAITAADHVLEARLAGRARASDGSVTRRLERNRLFAQMAADVSIENSGNLDDSIRALVALLTNGDRR